MANKQDLRLQDLRLIGWAYCGLTILVGFIALIVVISHIDAPAQARADAAATFAVLPQ